MSEVNEILFLFHLLVLDLPRERLIVSIYTEGYIRVDKGVLTSGIRAADRRETCENAEKR